MLCFEIWISLFVLKLFNILHSFLVTVVYRLQVRGKTLGLCSVQAIEVFKHQLVLVDSGISWKRAPKNFTFNNNLDTTWRQLGDNLETTWIQLKYNFVTTWTQRRHNFGKTMTQL